MTGRTKRFGFTTLNSETDRLDVHDWKFGVSDRNLLDLLLLYGEHHAHTGVAAVTEKSNAPLLLTETTDGRIPAGTTVYYKIGVVDENGQEGIASEMAVAHTADQVEVPGRPGLTPVLGGAGGLVPGRYSYAVSAFTGSVDLETQVSQQMVTLLRQTGSIVISLPAFPSGADGLNIYRKGPTDQDMVLLTSISNETSATYEDLGGVPANRHHRSPAANTTNMLNSILVTPSAVPAGSTWKIYRTFVPTQWDNSLVAWIDSSITQYRDTGHQTQAGSPALTGGATGTAPKVNLTDLAEADGVIPPGLVVSQAQVAFPSSGPVTVGASSWYWVCEYDRAQPVSFRAVLGRGFVPAAQQLEAKFQQWNPDANDWFDCFLETVYIPIGETIGPLQSIATYGATPYGGIFYRGDRVRLVVEQDGGGATQTDEDLVVFLDLMVEFGDEDVTHIWGS